jgi:hypothetical protein
MNSDRSSDASSDYVDTEWPAAGSVDTILSQYGPPFERAELKWAQRRGAAATSALGLGRVKTSAFDASVEHLGQIAHRQSQIILRMYRSNPCWRIVFSTFLHCMSFHAARVIRVGPGLSAFSGGLKRSMQHFILNG